LIYRFRFGPRVHKKKLPITYYIS